MLIRGSAKVQAAAVMLAAIAFLAGPLLVLRPNRLAAGQGLSAWNSLETWETGLLAGLILLLGLGAAPLRLRPAWAEKLSFPAAFAGVAFLAHLAGDGARMLMETATPYARISLGWGFWLLLLALGLVCADRLQRAGSRATALAIALWLAALAALFAAGQLDALSLVKEFQARNSRFIAEMASHLAITGLAVAVSATLGIPLGLAIHRWRGTAPKAFVVLNMTQTIPSLALFGLLIVPLSLLAERFPGLRELGVQGIGATPAIIALTLYALLPVVRNTYVGLESISPAVVDAGAGMGMSPWQLLRKVKTPLALPAILGGMRIALVQSIGNTAVAALIGAGGFGVFIFQGLGQAAIDLILLGALPTALLALAADAAMRLAIHLLSPPGLRRGQS